jgi:hypothetical protein
LLVVGCWLGWRSGAISCGGAGGFGVPSASSGQALRLRPIRLAFGSLRGSAQDDSIFFLGDDSGWCGDGIFVFGDDRIWRDDDMFIFIFIFGDDRGWCGDGVKGGEGCWLRVVGCWLGCGVGLWRCGENTGVLHCVQDDGI